MKIRIKGNSVRLRLTKTEVTTFCNTGLVEEQTQFLQGLFCYRLEAKDTIESLEASFHKNTVAIYMPEAIRTEWATSSRVGYEAMVSSSNGNQLSLLVEKDFVCLDETVEDQSDNYPNPLASSKP